MKSSAGAGPKQTFASTAWGVAVLYAIFGVVWIALSDSVLNYLVEPATAAALQTFKGYFFILVATAPVLYLLLRRREALLERGQEELRLSEERYRRLVETMTDGLMAQDDKGLLTYVNDRFCELAGLGRQELLGQPVSRLLADEESRSVMAEQLDARRGARKSYELVFLRRDGQKVYTLVAPSPIFDTVGHFAGSFGVVTDITERRRAEEALRKSENMLASIIDQSPIATWIADANGTAIRQNAANRRLFGLERDEQVIGRYNLFSDPTLKEHGVLAEVHQVFDEGLLMQAILDYDLSQAPRGQGPLAPRRRLRVTIFPIKDGTGQVTNAVVQQEDITDRHRAEQELRRERDLLSRIMETSPVGIMFCDRRGPITMANRRAAEILGCSREELVAKGYDDPLWQLVDQNGEPVRREEMVIYQVMSTGQSRHNVRRLLTRPDGQQVWISMSAGPLLGDDGQVEGAVAMFTEVTKLVRSEQELQASEANYRAIFNAVGEGIFVHDIESGAVLDINEKACEMFHCSVKEALAGLVTSLRPGAAPHDEAVARGWFRRAAEEGPQVMEWPARDLRERWFWTEVSLRRAWLGGQERLLAVVRDISQQKQAEQAQAESERRYRLLFDTMQETFALHEVLTGPGGQPTGYRLVEINQAFEVLVGRPASEIIGRTVLEMLPQTGPLLMASYGQVVASGQPKRFEIYAAELDKHFEVAAYRVPPGQLAALLIDVTARQRIEDDKRRLEQQLQHSQKMEAIGTLAGGLAHDFNNLLTGILGYASLLKMAAAAPPATGVGSAVDGAGQAGGALEQAAAEPALSREEVLEASEAIESAARRAAHLTGQLLGFARGGKYQNIAFDVHGTISEVLDLLRHSFDKNIAIEGDLVASNPILQGDPGQIHQVILNLAFNARDAMPSGGHLLLATRNIVIDEDYCRHHHGTRPGQFLEITIRDTGHGIPEGIRGRIFEPFFTTKGHGKGTGMGLAVVYGIVKHHGGWIHVYSEVDHGSTFRAYLPISKEALGAPPPPRSAEPVRGVGRIMLVDDEPVVQSVAGKMLGELGYEVVSFLTGAGAIDYYRQSWREVDLAIIDMIMPQMGGRECFAALKEINPALRAVLSTGYGLNGSDREVVRLGMAGFVQKPYEIHELSEVVAAALGRSK